MEKKWQLVPYGRTWESPGTGMMSCYVTLRRERLRREQASGQRGHWRPFVPVVVALVLEAVVLAALDFIDFMG